MATRWNALWMGAAALLWSHTVLAGPRQGEEAMGFDEPSAETAAPSEGEAAAPNEDDTAFLKGEEEKKSEEQQFLAAPVQEADDSRAEDPKKPYYLVGARFRWIMVPMWFIKMFGVDINTKDGRSMLINNVGAGAEFTYRKDSLDITAAIWWVGLSWKDGVAFKESGEPANSWELVTNDLSSLLFSVDFIWSTSLTDWFAFTYGVGIGIGIPIYPAGEAPFVRNESKIDDDTSGLTPCEAGDWSADAVNGCVTGEQDNEKYKLPTGIVPWINLLGGMRFKVHRHAAIYADFGFGIGFQAGVRGGYIF